MEVVTYMLKRGENSSLFYSDLAKLTDIVLDKAKQDGIYTLVERLKTFIEDENKELICSDEEYIFEFILLGVLWKNYLGNALTFKKHYGKLFGILYNIRTKRKKIKPFIDKIRGICAQLILRKRVLRINALRFNFKILKKLLIWLEATKEFSEEIKRLKIWEKYLETIGVREREKILTLSYNFGIWFERESRDQIGKYTENVSTFLKSSLKKYRFKENSIFVSRRDNEYHINMVGAEIMNRVLIKEFKETKQKIILLPTCMSAKQNNCKAVLVDSDLKCSGCTEECNINKIIKEVEEEKIEVVLIPHSSSFSKYIEKWRDQNEKGVVGVACVLNLLKGGYEMKGLNIPAQCVFLDYSGCKKHWHDKGIATNLDIECLKERLK